MNATEQARYVPVRNREGVGAVVSAGTEHLSAFLARPLDDVMSTASVLNRKPLRIVLRIPWGDEEVILKFYRPYRPRNPLTKPLALLRRALWKSHAAREWGQVHRLRRLGVRTPTPLAYFEYRRGPLYRRSFYFVAIPPGGCDLKEYLRSVAPGRPLRERRRVLRAVAVFLRDLHDRGIRMDDCRWRNFIVQASENPPGCHLVDYDLVYIVPKLTLDQRVPGLVQMNHSLSQAISLSERLRFFRWYYDAGEPLADAFRPFVNHILGRVITGPAGARSVTIGRTPYTAESIPVPAYGPAPIPWCSIIVPSLPEDRFDERFSGKLAAAVHALSERGVIEVILIDDGNPRETDRLLALLQGSAVDPVVLRHERSLGLGAAWNTGINVAMGRFLCVLDGQGALDPEHLRGLLRQVEDAADVAVGAGVPESAVVRFLYARALGRPVPSLTSTVRAFRREVARRTRPLQNGLDGLAENLCKALLLGYRVVEVEATGGDRRRGGLLRSPAFHGRLLLQLTTRSGPYRGMRRG